MPRWTSLRSKLALTLGPELEAGALAVVAAGLGFGFDGFANAPPKRSSSSSLPPFLEAGLDGSGSGEEALADNGEDADLDEEEEDPELFELELLELELELELLDLELLEELLDLSCFFSSPFASSSSAPVFSS